MGAITKQRVDVVVDVMQKSVVYMTNTLFQVILWIAKGRGLSPDYITSNRDIIERGFFTWLVEEALESLHFEIVSRDGSKSLERWDLNFEYSANPNSEVRRPPIDQIDDFCKKLRELPKGTYYRILVRTKPGASDVEGWQPTNFMPFSQSREEVFSDWGYGNISANLWYREGTW